jgi:hypothetical protein
MRDLEYIKSAMTDLESIKSALAELEQIKSAKDSLTEFVPTKKDLEDLANLLADDLISDNYHFGFSVGLADLVRRNVSFRLGRILDYLPELESEIRAKLRRGYEENDAAEPRAIEEMEAKAKEQQRSEAAKSASLPECQSPESMAEPRQMTFRFDSIGAAHAEYKKRAV